MKLEEGKVAMISYYIPILRPRVLNPKKDLLKATTANIASLLVMILVNASSYFLIRFLRAGK